MTSPAEAFQAWLQLLGPTEGGLSLDPHDPGNWTGGRVGLGDLVGTKFGISAAYHPDVDIPNLTIEEANQIRKEAYWDEVRADELPAPIAIMLAEAAYMSGPEVAVKTLQRQLGFRGNDVDGIFGPKTMARLRTALARPSAFALPSGVYDVVTEYAAQRIIFESSLGNWNENKLGWCRRIAHDIALALTQL